MGSEISENIETLLKEADLKEAVFTQADSEIFDALLGLQTLESAIESISKLSNKTKEELSLLKAGLQKNIFDQLENLRGTLQHSATSIQSESVESKEQHPAIIPGEVVHEVKVADQQPTTDNQQQDVVPDNLRSQDNVKKEENLGYTPASSPSKYPTGLDPYREPLE